MGWSDDMLTVSHQTQTFNATSGGMDIEVHGEITAPGEWWLHTAVGVLGMLPGKLTQRARATCWPQPTRIQR